MNVNPVPKREVTCLRASAEEARAEAAELRVLPPDQAAYLIEIKRAAAEVRIAALSERQHQLSSDHHPSCSAPHRDGPARDL